MNKKFNELYVADMERYKMNGGGNAILYTKIYSEVPLLSEKKSDNGKSNVKKVL